MIKPTDNIVRSPTLNIFHQLNDTAVVSTIIIEGLRNNKRLTRVTKRTSSLVLRPFLAFLGHTLQHFWHELPRYRSANAIQSTKISSWVYLTKNLKDS